MRRTVLLTGTAMAALISAMPAMAQEQKKNEGPHAGPPAAHEQQHAAPPQAAPHPAQRQEAPAQHRAAPTPRAQVEPSQPNRGQPNRGTAQRPEPNRSEQNKGQAQGRPEPSKNPTAQQNPQQPQNRQATTPPAKQPERNGTPPAKSAERRPEPGRDIRVTEQQKVTIHRDVFKERNINRVQNVNVTVRRGSHVPRSVRLAVLPAAIVALVPAYGAYRYFVVNDDICIVEPNSYEIVDVITQSGGGAYASLTLTPQERDILLRNIDLSPGRSTLGLGALNEGAPVPGSVEQLDVPPTVFDRVPKLQGYRYFVAEGRVALVDPSGRTIQLVIELN